MDSTVRPDPHQGTPLYAVDPAATDSSPAATSSPHRPSRGLGFWLSGMLLPLLPLAAGCSLVSRLDYTHLFSRQGWQRTDRVIETLAIEPGTVVADIGAGDGYFSFWLADAVGPEGIVYAVEIDGEKLAALRDAVALRGVENVRVVEATAGDPRLPPGSVDLVFLCNAYHHIDDRVRYFERLHASLTGRARVAIVDGKPDGAARLFIPSGHSIEPEVLVAELERAGYRPVARYDFLPLQSFDVFERAAAGSGSGIQSFTGLSRSDSTRVPDSAK